MGITPDEITAICEETRWLGDLYQASFAKDPKGPVKVNALVQTPGFVGDLLLGCLGKVLDGDGREPPITDLGGFRMIDPCCGTGHLLLQAMGRLFRRWLEHAPKMPRHEIVQRCLDSIHGVDVDPIAVSLAKLRLRRAGQLLCGNLYPWQVNVVWGDSLLPPEHELQPMALIAENRRLKKRIAELEEQS